MKEKANDSKYLNQVLPLRYPVVKQTRIDRFQFSSVLLFVSLLLLLLCHEKTEGQRRLFFQDFAGEAEKYIRLYPGG